MVFVIIISFLFVGTLTFLAFFPLRVSWFFHSDKKQRRVREVHVPRKKPNAYKRYNNIDDDSYDDPEL